MERGDERAEKTAACQEGAGPSSQLVCRCSGPEERQVIISSLAWEMRHLVIKSWCLPLSLSPSALASNHPHFWRDRRRVVYKYETLTVQPMLRFNILATQLLPCHKIFEKSVFNIFSFFFFFFFFNLCRTYFFFQKGLLAKWMLNLYFI